MPCALSFRAVEAVRQNPGVQFILNHCGLPYERDEHTMRVWREGEPLVGIIWNARRKDVTIRIKHCVV